MKYPDFKYLISRQSNDLTVSSVMSQENIFSLGFDDYWNTNNSDCIFNPVKYASIKNI